MGEILIINPFLYCYIFSVWPQFSVTVSNYAVQDGITFHQMLNRTLMFKSTAICTWRQIFYSSLLDNALPPS